MTDKTYPYRNRWRTTTRAQVLAKSGGRCMMCGWPGTDGRGKGLHLAHVIDHALGGSDEASNLIPLCAAHHRGYDAAKKRTRR